MFRRIISLILCFCFVFTQTGFAQVAGTLDLSGHFAQLASSLIQPDKFRPIHLRYLSYYPTVNNFTLLIDKGDSKKPGDVSIVSPANGAKTTETSPGFLEADLKAETKILLNYFFIGISLPNDTFWVNLRPDSPDSIIDSKLELTDIGKVMLESDLQLKKDTSSCTSPNTIEGRQYWDKLYKKAAELYGTDTVTIPTLTRPWIVPGEIIVRETKDSAYIYKATLKVMLESDYLKKPGDASMVFQSKEAKTTETSPSFSDSRSKALNDYSTQLIKELIIPKLTREVNTSKRYAPLRQVYYSLILAQWFKQRFKNVTTSEVVTVPSYPSLIDKNNLQGLTSKDPWSKDTYFNAYKRSFAEGEYNIKEPVYTPTGQVIRSYMSGGIGLAGASSTITDGLVEGKASSSSFSIFASNKNMLPSIVSGSGNAASPFDCKIATISVPGAGEENPAGLLVSRQQSGVQVSEVPVGQTVASESRKNILQRLSDWWFYGGEIRESDKEEIKNNGYQTVGGYKQYGWYLKLKSLVGMGMISYGKGVYPPDNDHSLSYEFAREAKKETIKVSERTKMLAMRNTEENSSAYGQSKRPVISVLVIGSGTGTDAIAVLRQARSSGVGIALWAIDISESARKSTEFNLGLYLHSNGGKEDDEQIILKKVELGQEFVGLPSGFDLIIFNAPNAVSAQKALKKGDKTTFMDAAKFQDLLKRMVPLLAQKGYALIANTAESSKLFSLAGLNIDDSQKTPRWSFYRGEDRRLIYKLSSAQSVASPVRLPVREELGEYDYTDGLNMARKIIRGNPDAKILVLINGKQRVGKTELISNQLADETLRGERIGKVEEEMIEASGVAYDNLFKPSDKIASFVADKISGELSKNRVVIYDGVNSNKMYRAVQASLHSTYPDLLAINLLITPSSDHLSPNVAIELYSTAGSPVKVIPQGIENLIDNPWMNNLLARLGSEDSADKYRGFITDFIKYMGEHYAEIRKKIDSLTEDKIKGYSRIFLEENASDNDENDYLSKIKKQMKSYLSPRTLDLKEFFLRPTMGGDDLSQVLFTYMSALQLQGSHPGQESSSFNALVEFLYIMIKEISSLSNDHNLALIEDNDKDELSAYLKQTQSKEDSLAPGSNTSETLGRLLGLADFVRSPETQQEWKSLYNLWLIVQDLINDRNWQEAFQSPGVDEKIHIIGQALLKSGKFPINLKLAGSPVIKFERTFSLGIKQLLESLASIARQGQFYIRRLRGFTLSNKGLNIDIPWDDVKAAAIIVNAGLRYPDIEWDSAIFGDKQVLEEIQEQGINSFNHFHEDSAYLLAVNGLREIRNSINKGVRLTGEQLRYLKATEIHFDLYQTDLPLGEYRGKFLDAVLNKNIFAKSNLKTIAKLINFLEGQCLLQLNGKFPGAYQRFKELRDQERLIRSINSPDLWDRISKINEGIKDYPPGVEDVFDIGAREHLFAHGVEKGKGGLESFINIILEGKIKANAGAGYAAQLVNGNTENSAGPHGPYYVVLNNKDNADLSTHDEFRWYLVPNEEIKQVALDVLLEASSQNIITKSLFDSERKKIITYEEFAEKYNKIKTSGSPITNREPLEPGAKPENTYQDTLDRVNAGETELEISEETRVKLIKRITGWITGAEKKQEILTRLSEKKLPISQDEYLELNKFAKGIAKYAEIKRNAVYPSKPLAIAEKILFTTFGYGYPYAKIDVMALPIAVGVYGRKLTQAYDEESKIQITEVFSRLRTILKVLEQVIRAENIDLTIMQTKFLVIKEEVIRKAQEEVAEASGSPIRVDNLIGNNVEDDKLGGIDMRNLPKHTKIEKIETGRELKQGLSPKGAAPALEDKELLEIQRLLNAGITPSLSRFVDWLSSLREDEINNGIDKALACIADILRSQEDKVCSTESQLKEILVLLESDKAAGELKIALSNIKIQENEPVLAEQ